MPPTGTPPKRLLPPKEQSLFKELLNLYETRQLKKAQKTADQILKKFPEHGGTRMQYKLKLCAYWVLNCMQRHYA
jgi:N-alpha-acetyltransferase 15/16, NatA auxiliary subunit